MSKKYKKKPQKKEAEDSFYCPVCRRKDLLVNPYNEIWECERCGIQFLVEETGMYSDLPEPGKIPTIPVRSQKLVTSTEPVFGVVVELGVPTTEERVACLS